ncbi:MAG: malate/lactate/ureidoglycolate dehydrogenase [Pseudomonadota bacterium]
MNIAPRALEALVTRVLTAAGAADAVAREVAAHLVTANLKGHDSHGVGMIPAYVHNLRNDRLDPHAHARVARDNGAVMLVDGGMGFGQVVGREATELALARARETGLVCVGVRNCHHLGRVGTYGEICGEAGYVSVHFVNVVGHEPQVSPFGGRERRMTTNPFCCVVPRADADPLVLDMATSAIALGKVRVAHMKGERVADGALVDHQGVPTSDPAVMFEEPLGALGPFGGHKGYGLAVMCELLGGALAGEWTAQPEHPRDTSIVNHMLMFVLDPDAFGGRERFEHEVEAMVAYLHDTTPARGYDRVRLPGEPEQECRQQRHDRIPVDDNTWAGLMKAAEVVGLSDAEVRTLTR